MITEDVLRTKDIVNRGIDRNFLIKCEKDEKVKLISPKKSEGVDITNKDYKPREYTQKDFEIVCSAYIYRKIGLSFDEIKQLINGEELKIRDSIIKLIQKYENQIEELQLLIEYLKYIKGFGIIPPPPDKLIGGNSFKDYLTNFINTLDPDKKVKSFLSVIEPLVENDIHSIEEEKLIEINSTIKEFTPNLSDEDRENLGIAYSELSKLMDKPPESPEVQKIIHKIYEYNKKANNSISAWDFALSEMESSSSESDIGVIRMNIFANIFGKEFLSYYEDALIQFLIAEGYIRKK